MLNKNLFFGSFGKKCIYHVTKSVKRLFLQFLLSFDFQKSILDDAIEDIKTIDTFWLKTSNIIFRYILLKV